jgi:alanyl-tRNA synthetase
MKSKEIRQRFISFFKDNDHKVVPSAPIVNKSDPTLMFTNAGMNQFKDYFLGNETPPSTRITDTQKCLRVSGKHNDLEEVGQDGYHHTMFEMLGNWSFGDYFKKEAIDWAWKLLTVELGIDGNDMYATVFGGNEDDNLDVDTEAEEIWGSHLPADRILRFGKKDNFWEMGETGPCGPCSELHIDLRSEEDKKKVPGKDLVNMDHPEVIEIWNLVFIQYNRSFGGNLTLLPERHVDTGMGFERLCMVLQGKTSSYDTDVFSPYIEKIEALTGHKYEGVYDRDAKKDIAFRVIADHIRAVAFAIADGQIPSNTGAGYVIRRILRRAVRYYYSFLNCEQPLMMRLIPVMIDQMGDAFPELKAQEDILTRVIEEEENSFLRTLDNGLKKLDHLMKDKSVVSGEDAFELYDTYGFPIDLTLLIAEEKGMDVDVEAFREALSTQKQRSRADAKKEVHDWIILKEGNDTFVGYDDLVVDEASILRFRQFIQKGKIQYQIVLDKNPFYAEGGGQVGDTGELIIGDQIIEVVDTKRENDLFLLITNSMFHEPAQVVKARVNEENRRSIQNNHTTTHLLHSALRSVLGTHVQQRGSLVRAEGLRFDFSHFAKLTEDELQNIEGLVNTQIRRNISREENREMDVDEAKESGAMMLFGEKYGDKVRMITFDPNYSRELCGGCHVASTGEIGYFKITSEASVAAGVRRIEAVTAQGAEKYVREKESELRAIKGMFKTQGNAVQQVGDLLEDIKALNRKIEGLQLQKAKGLKADLAAQFEKLGEYELLVANIEVNDSKVAKDLIYQLEGTKENAVILFGFVASEKPQLMLRISDNFADKETRHAGTLVRKLAANIKGGGGGQPFFATAGGGDVSGLDKALNEGREILSKL